MEGHKLKTLIDQGALDDLAVMPALRSSSYFDPLLDAYSSLDDRLLFQGKIHDAGHIERVMFLGAAIAMQQGLSDPDTKILLTGCAYHDIGRQNDSYEPGHGERAAVMLGSIELPGLEDPDKAIMQAAIAAHSPSSETVIYSYLSWFGLMAYKERAVLIAKCLKDADALDRCRIVMSITVHQWNLERRSTEEAAAAWKDYIEGSGMTNLFKQYGCDPKYLRFRESRDLIKDAEQLYLRYCFGG